MLAEEEARITKKKCHVPELMKRWVCRDKLCKQFKDELACLTLKHEKNECRPLGSKTLGSWSDAITNDTGLLTSFPLHLTMPPFANESKKSVVQQAMAHTPSIGGPVTNINYHADYHAHFLFEGF
jgi:hypothetical protein